MKKTGLFVLLLATASWAQNAPEGNSTQAPEGTSPVTASFPTERVQTPTYADLYCAGFISKQILPDANYVAGGLQTPATTLFTRGDMVYLQGSGYTAGVEYEIVRAPGDTTIPFAEKQTVTFHDPVRFDRFLQASNRLSGRIVMGKDFDSELGTGHKVYLNLGSNQGVKIGDFFRAVRSYEADLKDPVDSLSFKAAISEDTQKKTPSVDPAMFTKGNGPVIHVRDLPRRAVGEIVIIGVTNTTATGMVIFSMEDMHAGDSVELDQVQ